MYGVVCFRPCGRFDHAVGFAKYYDAFEYVQGQAADGCRYEIWSNGLKLFVS